jgi:hypothetical protein
MISLIRTIILSALRYGAVCTEVEDLRIVPIPGFCNVNDVLEFQFPSQPHRKILRYYKLRIVPARLTLLLPELYANARFSDILNMARI